MMKIYKFIGLKIITLNSVLGFGFSIQIIRVGSWVLHLSKRTMWLRANNKLYNVWVNHLPFSVRNGYKKAKHFKFFGKKIAYSVA